MASLVAPAMAVGPGMREGVGSLLPAFSSCSNVRHPSLITSTHKIGWGGSSSRWADGRGCITCYAGSSKDSDDEARSSLAHICHSIELCFFEVCIQNLGRPAGLSLHGFVSATFQAFLSGYTREQVSLQLTFGSTAMHEFEIGAAGSRLTATEEHYRSKWVDTIYTTLQILNAKGSDASRLAPPIDMYLYSTIRHVIEGQKHGDEQSLITFDRGLATKGASGGVVAGKVVLAPQLVPISQLVLLTMKVLNEQRME